MKVCIYQTSKSSIVPVDIREFDTIEECLRTLMNETGYDLYIVSEDNDPDHPECSWDVEIYDDYRE